MTIDELWRALATRGLIAEGQMVAVEADAGLEKNPSPWYVQIVLGVCAWLAGLMLLAFVVLGLFDVFFHGRDNWGAVLILGICACGCAAFLYRAMGETSTFGNQFALAISCAGQVGVALSLGSMGGQRAALWGVVAMELLLTAVVPSHVHRIFTTLVTVIAWALATHELFFGRLPGVSIFWSPPHTEPYQVSVTALVLWIVVWAPVAYAGYWLVAREAQWMAGGHDKVLRPVTYGTIAALSMAPLVTHPATFWMALGLGTTRDLYDGTPGTTALWPLLAMFLALLALALAFAIRNRPLMGLAIIFALLELSSFYYVLGTTLLVKSIVMVLLGGALLASARWLAKEAA